MTTSPAPDVDRVLDRMGRSAFTYRSFPRPDDAPEPTPPAGDAALPQACGFSLIADALPNATDTSIGVAVVPAPPATAAAPPPAPFPARPQILPDPVAQPVSLARMFRILAGAAAAPVRYDAPREPMPAFPFRRV